MDWKPYVPADSDTWSLSSTSGFRRFSPASVPDHLLHVPRQPAGRAAGSPSTRHEGTWGP